MRRHSLLAALAALALATPAWAQPKPVKVALIEDTTGPLEAYAKQSVTGFKLGLEYATHGSMTVAGRRIEVTEKDSQTKPDLGRSLGNGIREFRKGTQGLKAELDGTLKTEETLVPIVAEPVRLTKQADAQA